ncbi:AAA family ATPase [Streptomyces lavendulae]|uniref:AAA family ATPase n=1 Tax=Streptomyces lavendulae TaxID=1914 RepID=UPI0036E8A2FD
MTDGSGAEQDGSLIGREDELERLGVFLAGPPRHGGSLVLAGEPGIGKTALLTALTGRAEATGTPVLRATGVQYRTQVGYGALQQLLTSLPGTRSRAERMPALAGVLGSEPDAAPGHDVVTEAVVALMADSSREVPALLVLDDAQWLDRPSAVVLGQVARRLPGKGTGLVCTVRPGEQGFFDHSGLPLHELGPLGQAASDALLRRRGSRAVRPRTLGSSRAHGTRPGRRRDRTAGLPALAHPLRGGGTVNQ